MTKRKATDDLDGSSKKRRTRAPRKTAKHKAVSGLREKKKELRKEYKRVQKDLKLVDRDLKSLGVTIRKK